jgi:hypothetical protein
MIDIEKLRRAMRTISAKRGDFTLFALFRREDAPDGWDLVVSSSWLEEGKLKALGEFAEALKRSIGERQVRELSRIVTIKQDDPGLKAILSSIQVDDGVAEVRESVFFGLRVERAIFLRAKDAVIHEIQTA